MMIMEWRHQHAYVVVLMLKVQLIFEHVVQGPIQKKSNT